MRQDFSEAMTCHCLSSPAERPHNLQNPDETITVIAGEKATEHAPCAGGQQRLLTWHTPARHVPTCRYQAGEPSGEAVHCPAAAPGWEGAAEEQRSRGLEAWVPQ